jgi:cyclophilin family peptidyl-prolyl cis-trans isomerase/FKBP-type peptidyl-prolyl cis-trans isomerase
MAASKSRQGAIRRISVALGTCLVLSIGPVSAQDYPPGLYAEIVTTKGLIVASLDYARVPMTVASFVGLAEGTIENDAFDAGVPFFDRSVFDRVVPGHVIQGGRAASEASGGAGYRIPNEIHADLDHGRAGMLGMANGGPHTGSSIFYITLGDRSYLDGDYTVFGEVREGLDVVMGIVQGDVMESVRIVRVGDGAEGVRPTTGQFRAMVEGVERDVRVAAEERARFKADYVRERWPDARDGGDGWRFAVESGGGGETLTRGQTVTLRYLGHTPQGKEFASASESCGPGWRSPRASGGLPCDYVVGSTVITPGLDEAISRMSVGDRWTVIVPSELGYAVGGHYAPDRPGERRFHISPNTMLIYEVEILR